MIRHLHPTDSPALLQFKQRSAPDEVVTLARAIKSDKGSFPLMKYTSIALSPRAWQSCWVETRRASVQAVLRAGPRSGPHAWELSDLFLTKKNRGVAAEVLEQLAFPAGMSGARRIFLRMSSENDLFSEARVAGYHPAYTEDLYGADSAAEVLAEAGDSGGGLQMRPLDETDQHALFRLYCAAVPISVRSRMGQTFEEWTSSIEKPGRKARNWGADRVNSSGLDAYVQSCDVSGRRYFSVLCRNDAQCNVEELVAAGVGEAGERKVFTLVPSYNQQLARVLEDLGFTRRESYDVMVKTLAVAASETVPGLVAAGR